MTSLLAEMQVWAEVLAKGLWPAMLVFMRVGAMMALMPALGETMVPQRLRLVLALTFTCAVAPAIWQKLPETFGLPALLSETLIGLLLGIGLRGFVFALQIAGTAVAQATSLAQIFGGLSEPQPATGHLLVMAGLAIAVGTGLPVRVAEMVILSYDALPAGRMPAVTDVTGWGVAGTSAVFRLALQLSAPFMIAALIYNVALGFINRAMPSFMVSFIGAPALSAGGLVLLAVLLPVLLPIWLQSLNAFVAMPFGTAP